MDTIILQIKKYKELQNQVENLCNSNRIDSIKQSSNKSLELSELHSYITSLLEEKYFYYSPTSNYNENRSIVGMFLSWCDANELEINSATLHSLTYKNGEFISVYLQSNLFEENKFEFTHSGFWECVDTRSDKYETVFSIDKDTANPNDFASDSLKTLAYKHNYNLTFIEHGSYHEGWLYVGFNVC